jgi:hypothetical protein
MLPDRPNNSEMTLRRFCRWRRIPLDHAQRSVIGIELSQRAAQRQIPLRKVNERLDNGFRKRSRVYPLAFLEVWLREYRAGLPAEPAAAPGRMRAATSPSPGLDCGLVAE